MAQKDVEGTLSMDHIKGNAPKEEPRTPLSEVKGAIEDKAEESDGEAEPDKREQRSYTFRFKHVATDGTEYSGLFTNQILDLGKRLKVAQLESHLIGGVAYESVDPLMGNVAKSIAHMEYSLSAREMQKPKDWAVDFRNLDTASPVLELFEEVMGHEAIFLGVGKNKRKGKEKA